MKRRNFISYFLLFLSSLTTITLNSTLASAQKPETLRFEAAMKRGIKFGRPKKLSPEQKELILKLREEGKSATQLAKTFNVDRSTIYRLGE